MSDFLRIEGDRLYIETDNKAKLIELIKKVIKLEKEEDVLKQDKLMGDIANEMGDYYGD